MTLPVITSPDDWGRIMSDAQAWDRALHQVTEKAGLPFGPVEPGFPGSSAVFGIQPGENKDAYFVKFFHPKARADFSKEVSILEHLAGHRLLPALLAQGTLRGDSDFPYHITRALPGHAIRDCRPLMTEAESLKIASRLGLVVRELHALDLRSFKALPKDETTWARFVKNRREACLPELAAKGSLGPGLLDDLHGFLGLVEPNPSRLPPRLLHADLTEDHVYLEEDGGSWKLCGLLDWADAEIGDPFYEWPAVWFGACGSNPALFRAFLKTYEPRLTLNRLFRERALAYTLFHRFGSGLVAGRLPDGAGLDFESFLERLWPEELES